MKRTKFFCFCLLLLMGAYSAAAQIVQPVKWTFSISSVAANGTAVVTFKASIDRPWHMYDINMPADGPVSTSFVFNKKENVQLVGPVVRGAKPIEKQEAAFAGMTLRYYEEGATFSQKIKVIDPAKAYVLQGHAEFMCCNDQQCLPPSKVPFSFSGKGLAGVTKSAPVSAKPVDDTAQVPVADKKADSVAATSDSVVASASTFGSADLWTPAVSQLQNFGKTSDGAANSLLAIFLSGLLGGLIAIVTPCVWPIIPMTVSFFLKRSDDKRKGRMQALLYGLSIVVIYVSLGLLLTLLFDASALNSLSTNAVFNIFLFLLLILFAISFFGGFELMLPSSWSTAIDAKADKSSGVIGILLMACTLVIVSFSCTGPIIGTLLVSVATKGSLLGPAIGMLGFAIALAVPFTLFAFFPSWLHSLPRSGSWLNSVKVLLGFFELAFSLKFFSVADQAYGWHLLSRTTFTALWIVIFAFAGLYLLGKLRLPNDDERPVVSIPRFFLSLASFAFALYLIPGLFGAPLNVVSAFAPPRQKGEVSLYAKPVEARFNDYDQAMQVARQEGKPVVIDFTGYGCVNCRKMESAVWSDPEVQDLLANRYVLVSLFVDDRHPLSQPVTMSDGTVLTTVGEKWSYLQQHKFGANAQPFYVLIAPDGRVLNHSFVFSENPQEFVKFLQEGLHNFDK